MLDSGYRLVSTTREPEHFGEVERGVAAGVERLGLLDLFDRFENTRIDIASLVTQNQAQECPSGAPDVATLARDQKNGG